MSQLATAPAKSKLNVSPTVKLALLVFFLASSLVLALVPQLAHKSSSAATPPVYSLLVAGLVVIALNCGLFWYLNRLNLGFGRSALILAAGYNSIIAMVKLIFSPFSLYQSNQQSAFSTVLGDPNSAWFYCYVALFILLLYVGVFSVLYRYFVHKRKKALAQTLPKAKRPRGKLLPFAILIVAIIVIAMIGTGFWMLPVLVALPPLTYLMYVFGAFAIPMAIALALAVYLAYRGFSEVEQQEVSTGNAGLLASFFWIGLMLIFLYHVLWVVLLVTLIQLWPFQTYTPK